MKLLTQISNLDELSSLKALFARNGVLIHVANENTARNFGMLPLLGNYAVFIVLEEQYSDAKMLLADENHIVANKVDIAAYEEHVEQNKSNVLNHMLKSAVIGGIVILAAIYTIVWLLYR